MQITIESSELLAKIESLNPGLDLTGVKAWLFDIMMGTPPSAAVRPKAAAVRPQAPVEANDAAFDEDDIVKKMMGIESTVGGSSEPAGGFDLDSDAPARKATPAEKKAQREQKRATRVDFSQMTGKEVMEHITSQNAPKKKEGQKQFTDLGADDSGDTGGDDFAF